MRSMTLAIAGLILGFSALAAEPAQAQSFSASRTITHFDESNLRSVVTEMGGTMEVRDENEYLIRFSDGVAASAKMTVCEGSRCKGISLSARYGKPSDKTDSEVAALVHDFNARWNAGKAYLTSDGRAVVSGYLIVDGGISMENFRVQLLVYSRMLGKMRETIYTDG